MSTDCGWHEQKDGEQTGWDVTFFQKNQVGLFFQIQRDESEDPRVGRNLTSAAKCTSPITCDINPVSRYISPCPLWDWSSLWPKEIELQ